MQHTRACTRDVAELCAQAARSTKTAFVTFVRPTSRGDAPKGERLSLVDLVSRAGALGSALRHRGLEPRDRALIVTTGNELTQLLVLGAMQAGIVPVPLTAPFTASEFEEYPARVLRAAQQTNARTIVASAKVLQRLAEDAQLASAGLELVPLEALRDTHEPLGAATPDPEALACILLAGSATHASTLELTHGELLSALEEAEHSLGVAPDDVLVSWLPVAEPAGLMSLLLPLYCQISASLLSTADFLRRPDSWLEAITSARGTLSYAPQRAYALCTKRASTSATTLDLSSWRSAASVSGSMPAEVRAAFLERFAGSGLRAGALTDAPVVRPFEAKPPLSEGQKSLWFLAQVAPDSRAYNVSFGLHIRSGFDADALHTALQTIVRRHPALQSCFAAHAGVPYRRRITRLDAFFERLDVAGWSDRQLAEYCEREVERYFDLERGPLFVARLLVRGSSDAVLLLVAHHIIVDGLSMVRIIGELAELYQARLLNVPGSVGESSQSYGDFVRWQAQLLAGAGGQRLRDYWRDQLDGAPHSLELPTDRPRLRLQTFHGAAIELRLPGSLTAALRGVAKSRDTTLYTVLLSVFNVLLARLSGQRDLLVATPSMGRGDAAFSEVVGYFVNTLPVRARLAEGSTFQVLVDALRTTVLLALDHQTLPFNKLVELLGVPRDPSRTPLCQVLFQLHTYRGGEGMADLLQGVASGESASFGGLVVEPYALPRNVAQFELALDLVDFGGTVSGRLEYNTDLFAPATVRGWADSFLSLAEALAREPDAPLAGHLTAAAAHTSVSVLDPATRERVLYAWNDTRRVYPEGLVHRAIERVAASHPQRIALAAGELRLEYGELNRRANRLARELQALGAGRDVLIGVCMDRSLELVVTLLAIVKSGAAYVPLDPSYPRERLQFMREDAEPALIVVDSIHAGLLRPSAARLLHTEEAMRLATDPALDPSNLPNEPEPSDLVYVIYTSGSTGRPKGVGNVHAGLWNRLSWMQEYLELTERDCVLHKTPYSFDVSVWELFWPLMFGARLAIAKPEGHKDSGYLLDEIVSQEVTTVHFVPSMLDAFLAEPRVERASSLRAIVCSGEALSYATMRRCLARVPCAGLHNLYGPTEASIDVTAWKCEPNERELVPIGRPIANTQIYILDERREPVAIGAEGELYIGGVGLARGYHNRPELTAERFVSDPFASERGARMYKTGDLARFAADGTIEYLGRNDDQIKLRGFRVELGEIEASLREHPAVHSCAVLARPMPSRSARLEAFVVPVAATTVSADELGTWLARRLPEHMLPRRIHRLDSMPLTHSGKADRRALLALEVAPSLAGTHVAPNTPEERILAEIWEHVLGLRDVSIHDNYFALGGDSIRSLQVRARARERGLDVRMQSLLEHQTIAELAASLAQAPAPEPDRTTAPFSLVRPSERTTLEAYEDAFPATQLQLGMLYHSVLTRESWAYHDVMSLELELQSPFSEAALRSALGAVVQRHPALRSSFDAGSYARPLQLVHRRVELPFTSHDLSGLEPAAAAATVREHIDAERLRGYELACAPLFRVTVHVLSGTSARLTLGFHHAILDGWSTATLLNELLSEYLSATGVEGLPAPTAPAHSPAAFAELELEAIASEHSQAYFKATFADSELTRLPRWPETALAGRPGSTRIIRPVDEAVAERLRELASQLRAPLKALLLAAHARTLAVFSGNREVVTGWVTHGRPEFAGAERILGLFLNTLPVRVQAAGQSWAALALQLAQSERELHPHRRFPLREIQRLLDRKQLFETAFNFVNFHQYEALIAQGALRVSEFEAQENTSFTMMVSFVVDPRDGQLALHLEYDTQQLAARQAEQLARAHLLALEHMASDVHASVESGELITAGERAKLDAWSRGAPALRSEPLHTLFERQADRTPERIAAQFGARALSYAALDGWANDAARRLIEAGAKAGDVIAVCAEPSLERVVAVLGVLKAGGCCLPLAADLPLERLQYMLDKADARLALATRKHLDAPFFSDRTVVDIGEQVSSARLDLPIGLRDPAYAIYTSGSTGRPKAIVMPHEPLSNLAQWQSAHEQRSGIEDGAATLQFSLFSFDVSFQEMFCTWVSGGRLVIAPEAARSDTRELAKLLSQGDIARLFVPVVVLHQLAEVAEQLGSSWPSLREINTAGEQLEITAAVRALFRRHPRCRLQNQYGPSETHVATSHLLSSDPGSWPSRPPIGEPLPGVRAHVLDAAHRPVPIGVAGELYLGGGCLALGYRNDEERTRERFQPDPFEPAPGARLYQTGDVVRHLPDGVLEYVGRRDAQLKIRGYRVELGEIEAALVDVSEGRVTRAVALAAAGRTQASRRELVAYVVRAPGRELDLQQLRAALSRRLPDYMLPVQIEVLDTLPLLPSGKLDRNALPQRAVIAQAGERTRVAPASAVETELCGLWQEVLTAAEQGLGVTDDFFAAGGDSLSAVRLMARVQRRFGIELPISALIEAPTVRELARAIESAGASSRPATLIRLNGGSAERAPVFCVHPVGGHVLCYLQLARSLGDDQPCYGVQARGLLGGEAPHTSIVEMASAYAAEIMAAQPLGAIHLTGWSFGGVVAIELAQQLARAGREVAPVVLIDSVARARWNVQMSEDDLLQFIVTELFGVHVEDAGVAEILGRGRPRDRAESLARIRELAKHACERGVLPENTDYSQLESVVSVIQSNVQAVYDYEPRSYPGPVVLLRCTDPLPERLRRLHDLAGTTHEEADNGWSAYCPQLERIVVAGDHVSIVFDPHVRAVAEVLRGVVDGGVISSAAE